MRILAFSDLHCDLAGAERLVAASEDADLVIGAGDFASVHAGLDETIEALMPIARPTLLVPGNNEREDDLRAACEDWDAATVLHGEGAEVGGVSFWGLGAGVPTTPWDWSFDLDEQEAAVMLEGLAENAVLIAHSPPFGHADTSSAGHHLGSRAIAAAIEDAGPQLAVCGHIHESWGATSQAGPTRIVNLGPAGTAIDL
ncbi:MAG: metallophosphoesterase family protein [Solirubrobacterales bacterium]